MLTEEEFKAALPTHLKSAVTPSLINTMANVVAEPEEARLVRENLVSYTGVLADGKYKTEDYVKAVTYVSFKLMGHTNEQSYAKTFPDRYARLLADGRTKKEISAYVRGYNRGKLVNAVLEQTLIPVWIYNQDLFQQALNTQARIMNTAKSEIAQVQAANSILTHLQKPKDAANMTVNIDMKDTSGMKELNDTLREMTIKQRDMIQSNKFTTRDIAESGLIIEGEFDEK